MRKISGAKGLFRVYHFTWTIKIPVLCVDEMLLLPHAPQAFSPSYKAATHHVTHVKKIKNNKK